MLIIISCFNRTRHSDMVWQANDVIVAAVATKWWRSVTKKNASVA